MRRLAAVPALGLALTLAAQQPGLDLDALRSRALRYAQLAPAARVQTLGADMSYLGLKPESLPGGHFLVRFSGPHLGEDPDVLAVPLDWPDGQDAGARAAATLVELARVLQARHFRPRHGVWLLWSNLGTEGMNALLMSQEHQGKRLAHLIVLEGGWEGIATASEGRLAMELQFPAPGPALESLQTLLAPPPGVRLAVAPLPGGKSLLADFRTADLNTFKGLEPSLRASATRAGATAMGVRESLPPAVLPGGMGHPLAAWASAQVQRVLAAPPVPAAPRGGAMCAALARGVPGVALGLGVFDGARPADLTLRLAEGMQELP